MIVPVPRWRVLLWMFALSTVAATVWRDHPGSVVFWLLISIIAGMALAVLAAWLEKRDD